MKIYTIIILIFFYSFNAWAAPSGISISGDFSDGGTATITGNGFGSGSEQDFLGGIDGNINTGTTGNYFTPPASAITGGYWYSTCASGCSIVGTNFSPKYTTTLPRTNRTKSLESAELNADGSHQGSLITFGTPSAPISKFKWSYFIRLNPNGWSGQLKMCRAQPTSNSDDANGVALISSWNNYGYGFVVLETYRSQVGEGYPGEDYSSRTAPVLPDNEWVRIDIIGKGSSTKNTRDGVLKYYMYRSGYERITMRDFSATGLGNIVTYGDSQIIGTDSNHYKSKAECLYTNEAVCRPVTGSDWSSYWTEGLWSNSINAAETWGAVSYNSGDNQTWHFLHHQNWFATGGGTLSAARLYMDDIRVINGWSSLDLCDSNSLSGSEHCEPQKITTWSNESIEFEVNWGTFSNGATVFPIVCDDDDNCVAGASFQLGSSLGEESYTAELSLTNATTTGNPATVASGGNKSFTVTASFDHRVTCTGCDTWTQDGDGGTCAWTNITENKSATCTGAAKKRFIRR